MAVLTIVSKAWNQEWNWLYIY